MRMNTGGVILILLGVLILLSNFGILDWENLWRFWPLILVAGGIAMLFPRKLP